MSEHKVNMLLLSGVGHLAQLMQDGYTLESEDGQFWLRDFDDNPVASNVSLVALITSLPNLEGELK